MAEDIKTNTAGEKTLIKRRFIRPQYVIPVLFLLIIVVYFFPQARPINELHVYFRVAMDTSVELRFTSHSSNSAVEIERKVFAEIERLENIFSRSIESSDVSMINNSAGRRAVPVSAEVFYVAERGVDFARLSGGAFDPTIAPVIDLWGFPDQEYRVPAEGELKNILPLVDYTRIEFDREYSAICLPDDKMALELGGIAKGFIIDQVLQILGEAGVQHAFINAGGDIGLIGDHPDGKPWRIGVRHPREDDNIIAILPASGGAVVTSGDYERAFEEKGVMYHHILDPETGMPAGDLVSVTIMAETVIEADALSTAVFALGPERGMALIEELPGVEGILITNDIDILVSSGLKGVVELHH